MTLSLTVIQEVLQKDNQIEKLETDRVSLKRKAEDAETAMKIGEIFNAFWLKQIFLIAGDNCKKYKNSADEFHSEIKKLKRDAQAAKVEHAKQQKKTKQLSDNLEEANDKILMYEQTIKNLEIQLAERAETEPDLESSNASKDDKAETEPDLESSNASEDDKAETEPDLESSNASENDKAETEPELESSAASENGEVETAPVARM